MIRRPTTCQKWCWIGFLWMFVNVSHYIVLWAVIVTHPIHLVLHSADPKITMKLPVGPFRLRLLLRSRSPNRKNQKNKMDREKIDENDLFEQFEVTQQKSLDFFALLFLLVKVDPSRNFWRNLFLRGFSTTCDFSWRFCSQNLLEYKILDIFTTSEWLWSTRIIWAEHWSPTDFAL